MFGNADAVFVGYLETLGVPTERRDPMSVGPQYVPAAFRVKHAYKGALGVAVDVHASENLVLGREYLVFAQRAHGYAPEGQLFANFDCQGSAFDLGARGETEQFLAFLDALPAEGSGGDLVVVLRTHPDWNKAADALLSFERNGGSATVSRHTDEYGAMDASSVPAGMYRLTTVAPPGFRYNCGNVTDYEACDALVVLDRGRVEHFITLEPTAALKVRVTDAAGRPAEVRAQFDVFEPGTGRRIGVVDDDSYMFKCRGHACAASGRVVPGLVVVGLVLPRIRAAERPEIDAAPSIVFADGGTDPKSARSIELRAGDNEFVFHLPPALQPVRATVKVVGSRRPSAFLLTDDQTSRVGYVALDDGDAGTFWAIPGQSFSLSAYVDGGKFDSMIVQPQADGEVTFTSKVDGKKSRP